MCVTSLGMVSAPLVIRSVCVCVCVCVCVIACMCVAVVDNFLLFCWGGGGVLWRLGKLANGPTDG